MFCSYAAVQFKLHPSFQPCHHPNPETTGVRPASFGNIAPIAPGAIIFSTLDIITL